MMNGEKSDLDGYARRSKEHLQANVAFMRAFSEGLKDSGVFVASEGLAWPNEARIARADKSGVPITDGVFPESKEFLAGYWIVDVESAERAFARGPCPPQSPPARSPAPQRLLKRKRLARQGVKC
jgi:hypothetical protein